jgi:hypothetical protein
VAAPADSGDPQRWGGSGTMARATRLGGDPFGAVGKRALIGYGPSTAARTGGGTPPVAGRRSSGGHQLGGQGAAVSLGGGCGDKGGPGEQS